MGAAGRARRTEWVVLIFASLALAGCGGNSGPSSGRADPDGGRAALSLTASPAVVESGGFSTLRWSASNARSCEASGGWSGSRGPTGSEQVGPLASDTEFRLSCSGAGGGVQRQVTVSVDAGNGASLTLRADPEQIPVNGSSVLTWSSDDATSCTASGAWSGARNTAGSFSTGPLTQSATYTLSCTGPSGNALASVTVEVLDKVLRWQPPTQNVDGTPLTDLAGFNIYWGAESRSYGTPHTIADPNATEWEANLPPGRYYFALTAFDRDGSESGYSNEVIKTIL